MSFEPNIQFVNLHNKGNVLFEQEFEVQPTTFKYSVPKPRTVVINQYLNATGTDLDTPGSDKPTLLSSALISGNSQIDLPPLISLGSAVGCCILMYGIFWVVICRFQEFSFQIRAMKRMYKVKLKGTGPNSSTDKMK